MNTSSLPLALSSPRRLRRLVTAALALATALILVVAAPSLATEATEATAGDTGEEGGKITFPSDPHDQFGLVLIGAMGIAALAAGINALAQLRGERPGADGKIRWR